jgi:hypothetical protein
LPSCALLIIRRHATDIQLARVRTHASSGKGSQASPSSVRDLGLWDRTECTPSQRRRKSHLPKEWLLLTGQILFTKTRILSIKVQTLDCFKAMVKTLDKATLTTKLVPLLAKIKTKGTLLSYLEGCLLTI